MNWNHPNFLVGFLADLACLVYAHQHRRDLGLEPDRHERCHAIHDNDDGKTYCAAKAIVRYARRVWDKQGRRKASSHLKRLLGPRENTFDRMVMFNSLTRYAARILVEQSSDNDTIRGMIKAATVACDYDEVSDIEIRWRIRDWLAGTDVHNVPPNVRLAASAAWSVGASEVAHQIVMAAVEPTHGS